MSAAVIPFPLTRHYYFNQEPEEIWHQSDGSVYRFDHLVIECDGTVTVTFYPLKVDDDPAKAHAEWLRATKPMRDAYARDAS
jgi:hypothetical protein